MRRESGRDFILACHHGLIEQGSTGGKRHTFLKPISPPGESADPEKSFSLNNRTASRLAFIASA